jgi:DNA-binding transcriptional LysR family regulator
MQIAKLEHAVGRPVLVRTPRRLDLTAAGRELLQHARRLVALHDETVQAMRGEALSGHLTVGAPEDYAVPYLAPVLREFSRRHAGVELTLVCQQSSELIPRVLRGEVDVAVVTQDRVGRGRPLFDENFVWAAPAQSQAWRASPLPIALYEVGSKARTAVLAALRSGHKPYRVVCESASPAGMLAAVEAGLAVALFTRCSVPAGFEILGKRHGLPPLPSCPVVLLRSRASTGDAATDAMEEQVLRTLRS